MDYVLFHLCLSVFVALPANTAHYIRSDSPSSYSARGKVIPSRDLMEEFCQILKVPESELLKADDFSRSSEEVELLELVEKRNMAIKGALSIRDNYDVIYTPIYDPETGAKKFEIITPYDQAKEALLHEFQKMTLDELLNLYRYFANGKHHPTWS